MVTTLEHNAAVRRQQQANADNAAQSAAFWALRGGGKAEAAAQMKNPISTQTFNTKQGVYVVQGRTTENDVRAVAEMISTSQNSSVMPSSDAQNQISFGPQLPVTSYVGSLEFVAKNLVSNNNVNPLVLYGPQPVNSNNKSQNSTPVSNSIVTNANYNYATDMNNYQTANPGSDVNMDIGGEKYVWTDKSTAPKSNEVETSLLGGDIQHQETDLTTNMESTPPLVNQAETNVNSDSGNFMSRIGAGSIALAGVATLFLINRTSKRERV